MKPSFKLFILTFALCAMTACGPKVLPVELINGDGPLKIYQTPDGEQLGVELLGHGSVRFSFNDKNFYVDPYSNVADYSKYPAADIIFISHSHGDHYDVKALDCIANENTPFVISPTVPQYNGNCTVVKAGDSYDFEGVHVDIVEAYNIASTRPDGNPYHPKGEGIGFIFDFGGCRVYVAGDTEPTPEMMSLTDLDIAFIPKNVPYTMTDEQFVSTVNALMPKFLYPYHFFEPLSDTLVNGIDPNITVMK